MKHIYIFNHTKSKGYVFGVGTYIRQLLQMKHDGFAMHIVQLNANVDEVTVETKEDVEEILFPKPILTPQDQILYPEYHTSVIRILRHYIDNTADNIFHLNNVNNSSLAKSIKRYLHGKTVLTIHYSQSLFDLKGNICNLHEIIQSPVNDDDPPLYASVRNEIINTSEMIEQYVDKVISIAHHSFLQNNEIYRINNKKNILIYNTLCDELDNNLNKVTELKKELGIHCSEKIIIYAGRLDEIKGVQCLLQALSILKEKGLQFHLFIAGSGHFEATIDFVRDLYTNITFTGLLSKDKLYQLYSVADIGVFPSLYEEFGYVILEMMMHRLPVVAYRTSGPAEIVEDGHTGLLAELSFDQQEQSIRSFAEKIERLLVDPDECRRMGSAGRERFLKYFSKKTFKKKMNRLYSSL